MQLNTAIWVLYYTYYNENNEEFSYTTWFGFITVEQTLNG